MFPSRSALAIFLSLLVPIAALAARARDCTTDAAAIAPRSSLSALSPAEYAEFVAQAKAVDLSTAALPYPIVVAARIPFASAGSQGSFQGFLEVNVRERGEVILNLTRTGDPLRFMELPVARMTVIPEAPGTLEIQWTKTYSAEELRKGIQNELRQKALILFPDTRKIHSTLEFTNEEKYKEGLSKGLTPLGAAKETPAYRMLRDQFEIDAASSILPDRAGPKIELVLRRKN